jgi:hypothetical protein
VVLGDSFTEGFGAPDDSTFTERLKHHLGGRPGTIEVFNAGICGSNPAYEIELYKKKFRDYPANLVIMVSNLTDVSDIEYTLRKSEIPVTEYFIAVSHIFRIVYWGIFHHEMTISNASDAITGRRDENLAVLVRMIDSFNDSLAGNHQLFKLFYLPMTIELYNFKGNTPTSSLIDSYHHASLPLTDLRGAYKKNIGPRDSLFNYYWKIDGHHTSRGYDLMATCVADEIKHYFTTDTSGKYFTTHSINP